MAIHNENLNQTMMKYSTVSILFMMSVTVSTFIQPAFCRPMPSDRVSCCHDLRIQPHTNALLKRPGENLMLSCVVRCGSFEYVTWVNSNGDINHHRHSSDFSIQRGECDTTTNTQMYTLSGTVTNSTIPIVESVYCKGLYLGTKACYSAVVEVSLQTSDQDQVRSSLPPLPALTMIENTLNETIELVCTVPRRLFSSVTWILGNSTWDPILNIRKPSNFQRRLRFFSDKNRACLSPHRYTTYTLVINVSDSTTLQILPNISCAGVLNNSYVFSRLVHLRETQPTMSTPVLTTCDDQVHSSKASDSGSSAVTIGTTSSIDIMQERPTILQLTILKDTTSKKVEIIKSVAGEWKKFGVHLDFDETGKQLNIFELQYAGRSPEDACVAMFQYWLEGNGVKATWGKLIEVLQDFEESTLATDLKKILELKFSQSGL